MFLNKAKSSPFWLLVLTVAVLSIAACRSEFEASTQLGNGDFSSQAPPSTYLIIDRFEVEGRQAPSDAIQLNKSEIGTELTISVVASSKVASLHFMMNGQSVVDNNRPYQFKLTTKAGVHQLVATPFGKSAAKGPSGDSRTLTIQIIEDTTPTPTPTPVATPTPTPTPVATPTPTPTPVATPTPTPTPAPKPSSDYSLLGDPDFTESSLPATVRVWYSRFLYALNNPNAYPNADEAARTGDLYQIGRTVSRNVSTALLIFRLTGDLRLLDRIDRTLQIARAELRDTNGDGYPNWRWLMSSKETAWYGDDQHVMDEIMSHGFLAEVAWAYRLNQNFASPAGVNYKERATFWAGYLQQWEAKWRARNGKATGFPFIWKNLTHPYLSLIRYLRFTHLLKNDSSYLQEAIRLADAMNMYELRSISTPNGPGLVWAQGITKKEPTVNYLQPVHYSDYSVLFFLGLSLESFTPFTIKNTIIPIANTIAYKVVDNGSTDFAPSIGGSSAEGGFTFPTGEPRTRAEQWAIYSLGLYAVFDRTDTIATVSEQVYAKFEADPNRPRRISMAAAMIVLGLLDFE